MGKDTDISWCDHTFNLWWGCWKISPGCANCYAEAHDARDLFDEGSHWGKNAPRRFFGDDHWKQPLAWNRAALREGVRRRVFCMSMGDVFEDREDLVPHRERLWRLIQETPHLDWLLLTKRPENFARMLPWTDRPWTNVWPGVTAENNEMAELRIPILRATAAHVRFVSCEPILEHIAPDTWDLVLGPRPDWGDVHWLIVGDESGRKKRPAMVEWVRDARDAAARHRLKFHFKQWAGKIQDGIRRPLPTNVMEPAKGKIHLPVLDGRQWAEFPTGGREGR